MDIKKSSGLIFHPTSLPGKHGIGNFGENAKTFVDYLVETNTKIWQVLPLGPTDELEYSPYSSPSSVLGNINLIDLDNLHIQSEFTLEEDKFPSEFIDFKNVYKYKSNALYNISKSIDVNEHYYQQFLSNKLIREHITFLTLNKINQNPWFSWNETEKSYSEHLFEYVSNKYEKEFKYNLFTQYEFTRQWDELKQYANKSGIKMLGDIPIYVNHNSADVWSNNNLFELDNTGNMSYVSGAVPDEFTADGQVWNTTLYDWDINREENYEYWINKLKSNLDKVDYLRIDHFVGFFQYWAIPIKESALNGSWRKGPWKTFFEEVSKVIPMSKLVAEDLGVVLSETEEILRKYNIPGMKVLQQRIPSDINHDEIHPNEWKENLIAYTGTHDSPTIKQWFGESNEIQIEYFNKYKQELNFKLNNDVWDFISLVWESPAQVSVTTVQDLLELDKEARFNSPGTKTGNWGWRLEAMDQLDSSIKNLKLLNEMNSRNI